MGGCRDNGQCPSVLPLVTVAPWRSEQYQKARGFLKLECQSERASAKVYCISIMEKTSLTSGVSWIVPHPRSMTNNETQYRC
ncbi:hypothetical protein XENTR_v10020924 [Xenopus tropicalis]|nr:hypothetical protein XENTR_v10020924 [Xenopus tropicalis]